MQDNAIFHKTCISCTWMESLWQPGSHKEEEEEEKWNIEGK